MLASANPVGSRYNPQLSVVENIQLPPSLMSRFDLIYLVRRPRAAAVVQAGAAISGQQGRKTTRRSSTDACCRLLPVAQLLDKANEATDRKLARHLVSLYGNGVGRLGNEVGPTNGSANGWFECRQPKSNSPMRQPEIVCLAWPQLCCSLPHEQSAPRAFPCPPG